MARSSGTYKPEQCRFAFDVCQELFSRWAFSNYFRIHVTALESGDGKWRPQRSGAKEFIADFAIAGERALRRQGLHSRLILFKLYFVAGAEYQAALKQMKIGEITFVRWSEEVRQVVGAELLRRKIYPPRQYFEGEK